MATGATIYNIDVGTADADRSVYEIGKSRSYHLGSPTYCNMNRSAINRVLC